MGSSEDRLSYRHSTPGAVGSGLGSSMYSSPGGPSTGMGAGVGGSTFLTPESALRSAGTNVGSSGGSMTSADRLAEARARLLRTSRDSADGNANSNSSPAGEGVGKRWRAARAARAGQAGGGQFWGVPTNIVVFLVAIVSFTAGAFVSNPRVWRLFSSSGIEGGEGGGELALRGDPRIMYSSDSSSSSSSSGQLALAASSGAANGVIVVLKVSVGKREEEREQ